MLIDLEILVKVLVATVCALANVLVLRFISSWYKQQLNLNLLGLCEADGSFDTPYE
jgi:hypothetical protein